MRDVSRDVIDASKELSSREGARAIGCDVTYLRRPQRPPLQVGTEADRNRCLGHAALSGSGGFRRIGPPTDTGLDEARAVRKTPAVSKVFHSLKRVFTRAAKTYSSDGSIVVASQRRRRASGGGQMVDDPCPPVCAAGGGGNSADSPANSHACPNLPRRSPTRPDPADRDGGQSPSTGRPDASETAIRGTLTAKTTPYQRIMGHRLANRAPVRTHSHVVARAVRRGRGA